MKISICVGSSCHLKGSYDIIQLMKESVAAHQLEDRVEVAAAFCLGHCTDGVSVKFDETIVGVNTENFQKVFQEYVLDRL